MYKICAIECPVFKQTRGTVENGKNVLLNKKKISLSANINIYRILNICCYYAYLYILIYNRFLSKESDDADYRTKVVSFFFAHGFLSLEIVVARASWLELATRLAPRKPVASSYW